MKFLRTSFISSFVILLISFLVAYLKLSEIDSLLVLYFDKSRGILFGSTRDVYAIPLFGAGLTLINIFLASGFYKKERFFSTILALASILISILILIGISVIVANN